MPSSIVTDCNPCFILNLTCNLYKIIEITQDMFIVAHPKTDGQLEWTIQTLEQYLRIYISY